MFISVTVNGKLENLEVEPHLLLVDLLREKLGLTGTKNPLDFGQTGACTVLMNGRSVKSSMMLAVQAHGSSITTVEGLSLDGVLSPVQQSFIDNHAIQCGYCTPAALLVITELLASKKTPTEQEIRSRLEGVLCRCTGYQNIIAAALQISPSLQT